MNEDWRNEPITKGAAVDAADRADYTGLAVEDVKKVTDEVVKELKQLPTAQPQWIPVTERLPESHKDVLVFGIEAINNKYLYRVKCWDVGTWRPTGAPSCIWLAWMPLPEPYREKKSHE